MSDSYSICNICGSTKGRVTTIESLKTQVIESIHSVVIEHRYIEDTEPKIEELLIEYQELREKEKDGIEGKCSECDNFTSFIVVEFETHNENTAHFP